MDRKVFADDLLIIIIVLVYCEITNTKCALFDIVADLFDFYAYYERSYYTYYNRGAGCTSYLLLGMIIMLSNGITNIFIAWFYHSFGADSLSALKEEATTNGNEPTQYAIKPVQQPTYGKENQEASVDVEEATDCIMIGCSIIVAVLEVLLFILLVRDCGNRFRYLQFPQLGYHLLLGVLAGYSIYIACMHAVPVYHSAALVRTGQSMVMFVMCFISLFHSAVKFTGGFGHGGDSIEGVEYFIYGILAAIFACLYAVVAYIYKEYDAKNGISTVVSLEFLNDDIKFNAAPNQVQYQGFDHAQLHQNENIDAAHIENTPHLSYDNTDDASLQTETLDYQQN
jgi:hypothetical protein